MTKQTTVELALPDLPEPLSPEARRRIREFSRTGEPPAPGPVLRSKVHEVLRGLLHQYCHGHLAGQTLLLGGARGAGKTRTVRQAVNDELLESRSEAFENRTRKKIAGKQEPRDEVSRQDHPTPWTLVYVPIQAAAVVRSLRRPATDCTGGDDWTRVATRTRLTDRLWRDRERTASKLTRTFLEEVARGLADSLRLELRDVLESLEHTSRRDPASLIENLTDILAEESSLATIHDHYCALGIDETGALGSLWGERNAHRATAEIAAVHSATEAGLVVHGHLDRNRMVDHQSEASVEKSETFSIEPFTLGVAAMSVGVLAATTSTNPLYLALGTVSAGLAFAKGWRERRRDRERSRRGAKFTHDTSTASLFRRIPFAIERLQAAGLRPVFVIDEWDKIDDAEEIITLLMGPLKAVLGEHGFFIFLVDDKIFEGLSERQESKAASTFFQTRLHLRPTSSELARFVYEYLDATVATINQRSASSGSSITLSAPPPNVSGTQLVDALPGARDAWLPQLSEPQAIPLIREYDSVVRYLIFEGRARIGAVLEALRVALANGTLAIRTQKAKLSDRQGIPVPNRSIGDVTTFHFLGLDESAYVRNSVALERMIEWVLSGPLPAVSFSDASPAFERVIGHCYDIADAWRNGDVIDVPLRLDDQEQTTTPLASLVISLQAPQAWFDQVRRTRGRHRIERFFEGGWIAPDDTFSIDTPNHPPRRAPATRRSQGPAVWFDDVDADSGRVSHLLSSGNAAWLWAHSNGLVLTERVQLRNWFVGVAWWNKDARRWNFAANRPPAGALGSDVFGQWLPLFANLAALVGMWTRHRWDVAGRADRYEPYGLVPPSWMAAEPLFHPVTNALVAAERIAASPDVHYQGRSDDQAAIVACVHVFTLDAARFAVIVALATWAGSNGREGPPSVYVRGHWLRRFAWLNEAMGQMLPVGAVGSMNLSGFLDEVAAGLRAPDTSFTSPVDTTPATLATQIGNAIAIATETERADASLESEVRRRDIAWKDGAFVASVRHLYEKQMLDQHWTLVPWTLLQSLRTRDGLQELSVPTLPIAIAWLYDDFPANFGSVLDALVARSTVSLQELVRLFQGGTIQAVDGQAFRTTVRATCLELAAAGTWRALGWPTEAFERLRRANARLSSTVEGLDAHDQDARTKLVGQIAEIESALFLEAENDRASTPDRLKRIALVGKEASRLQSPSYSAQWTPEQLCHEGIGVLDLRSASHGVIRQMLDEITKGSQRRIPLVASSSPAPTPANDRSDSIVVYVNGWPNDAIAASDDDPSLPWDGEVLLLSQNPGAVDAGSRFGTISASVLEASFDFVVNTGRPLRRVLLMTHAEASQLSVFLETIRRHAPS